MNREEFIIKCNDKIKLVRTEYDFSQDKMAHILGLSKKTLVEIEKSRSSLGWSGSVTLCSIFGDSEILASVFGDKPTEVVMALAFDGSVPVYRQTGGGKVFWNQIDEKNGYKLQQNIISQHYRILNPDDMHLGSSFELETIKSRFMEVAENG